MLLILNNFLLFLILKNPSEAINIL